MKILINEKEKKIGLKVITCFYSFSEIRFGAFSLIEKLKLLHKKDDIFFLHDNSAFKEAFFERNPFIKPYKNEKIDKTFFSIPLPWEMLENTKEKIDEDFYLVKNQKKSTLCKNSSLKIVGNKEDIFIDSQAHIYPYVVFDTANGKIIVEDNVQIFPFTYIKGPIFIGKNTCINGGFINSSIIGKNCGIGGEVSNSIIQDFTNKNHEGFLGHSFVSSWVNIGAIATTSNLKNNYGIVKLEERKEKLSTNSIKFGSIIGNFVKIGIGTMLNTGTVIDIGSNIFSNQIKKYISPFSWGLEKKYEFDKFIQDTKRIMKRRNIFLKKSEENLLKELYMFHMKH